MPQQPIARRPSPPTSASAPDQRTEAAPTKAADLTVNKVLAGAGAAATSAVLGSFFGATGTVTGAALGSVASTVATTLYQRSLDRTRDTLVAKIQLRPGRGTGVADQSTTELTVPMQRVSPDAETTQLRVEPARRRPRQLWLLAGVTVLVFVLGLLAVTGVEWAKGSTITTGQPGTSIGRVLAPVSTPDEADGGEEQGAPGSESESADSDESGSGDPRDGDPGADGSDSDRSDSGTPPDRDTSDAGDSDGAGAPTPSQEPGEEPAPADEGDEPGSETGRTGPTDEGQGAQDGGALRTPVVPTPAAPTNR